MPSWLSGEWAGESIYELLGDLDGLPDWQRDAICDAFENAATLAYVAEVERSARYHVEQTCERLDCQDGRVSKRARARMAQGPDHRPGKHRCDRDVRVVRGNGTTRSGRALRFRHVRALGPYR